MIFISWIFQSRIFKMLYKKCGSFKAVSAKDSEDWISLDGSCCSPVPAEGATISLPFVTKPFSSQLSRPQPEWSQALDTGQRRDHYTDWPQETLIIFAASGSPATLTNLAIADEFPGTSLQSAVKSFSQPQRAASSAWESVR